MYRISLAVAAVAAVIIVTGLTRGEANAASGTTSGWALSIGGHVAGIGAPASTVTLPPAGTPTSGGVPLNINAGVDLGLAEQLGVGVSSGTVVRQCGGAPQAPTVWVECSSRIEGLSIGLDLPLLLGGGSVSVLTASVIEARARCTSSGGDPECVDTGTTITNLCVLGNGCINASGQAVIGVSVPLVANGTVTIGQRSWRSSQGGMSGEGLTVALLGIDLNLLPSLLGGIEILSLNLASADAFLGDVTPDPTATPTSTSTPSPSGTQPPGPTATATPPPGSTATPTPPPGATATPTSTPIPGSTATPTPPTLPQVPQTSTPTPPSGATATPSSPQGPGPAATATPRNQPPRGVATPLPPATGLGGRPGGGDATTVIGIALLVIASGTGTASWLVRRARS